MRSLGRVLREENTAPWAEYGIKELPGKYFRLLDGPDAGKLRAISGSSIKRACRHHSTGGISCELWLSCKDRLDAGERDVIKWLGQARSCVQTEHARLAYDIKVSYGMQPRASVYDGPMLPEIM